MNDTKLIWCKRPIDNGLYFSLIETRTRKLKEKLNYYLDKFEFEDYWCYKATGHQKSINLVDFLKFDYSSYIFFNKKIYNNNFIEVWINWFKELGGVQFLHRPTPPFHPKKIKIIE